jgi:CelD/BcsL family acetyltransferase involved in cellulose biosynthesis
MGKGRMMPAAHRMQVITEFTALERLSSEWNDLWSCCPSATSFQRPEWVLSWTRAFQPTDIFVVEVRRGQTLVGLAPLFLYHSGQERILAPLAASVSDYLDWLIEPSARSEVLVQILERLRSSDLLWHRLDLTDLPGTSALLQIDVDDWDGQRSEETACPVLTLPSAAGSVEDILSAKPRHNLRTARRRTQKLGDARIEIANEATLDEFLSALMNLHRSRWTECGASGMLAEDRVQEFHRRAAPALLRRNVLRLYGLRLNGRLIATLYALVERDTVYCYLQGFDPAYSSLSPGAQIVAAVIDDALHDGKREVDFLRGREPYKYVWGARDRQTYRLCLRHGTSASRSIPSPIAA